VKPKYDKYAHSWYIPEDKKKGCYFGYFTRTAAQKEIDRRKKGGKS